jgi:hypothetical protein
MQQRLVILTIDDILRMLADYCGPDDIPSDSQPITLQFNATQQGKLSIIIESNELQSTTPIEVKFDLRKSVLVG